MLTPEEEQSSSTQSPLEPVEITRTSTESSDPESCTSLPPTSTSPAPTPPTDSPTDSQPTPPPPLPASSCPVLDTPLTSSTVCTTLAATSSSVPPTAAVSQTRIPESSTELTASSSDCLLHDERITSEVQDTLEPTTTAETKEVPTPIPSSDSPLSPTTVTASQAPIIPELTSSSTTCEFSKTESTASSLPSISTESADPVSTSSSSPIFTVSCSAAASTSAVTTVSDTLTTSTSSTNSLCTIEATTDPRPKDKMEEVCAAEITPENGGVNEMPTSNPMDELDDVVDTGASKTLVAPSNTPITGDSGHNSPVLERSSTGSSDDGQKEKVEEVKAPKKVEVKEVEKPKVNNPAPVKETTRVSTRESKKDKSSSSKNKKKEDKGIEYILRALNSLQTPEEKLAALCKRYADMHEEHRVLQTSFKTQQRSMTVLMREKDQTQSDHAKAIIAKSKLESLCRELQRQNKLIKDESIQRAKEDDEKRREISARFQTTIGEIQTQMNNNNDRNSKLQKENLELAGQLKKFVEQYENREQKMKQHRDLEQQVAEARLAQAKALLREEQEKNGKEKELLLMKAAESGKKVSLLEAQVAMFKERYDEFESLHTRSNETFQKYKTEMDKMTKRIKRLEKDGLSWKSKWERTNKSLIESLEARGVAEKETTVYVQKVKKLESLCRALQAELHKDKVAAAAAPKTPSPVDEVPPNSPETPSASGQTSPGDDTVTQSSEAASSSSSGSNSKEATVQSPDSTTSPQEDSPAVPSNSSDKNQQQAGEAESEKTSSTTTTPSPASPEPVAEACQS